MSYMHYILAAFIYALPGVTFHLQVNWALKQLKKAVKREELHVDDEKGSLAAITVAYCLLPILGMLMIFSKTVREHAIDSWVNDIIHNHKNKLTREEEVKLLCAKDQILKRLS